MHNHQYKVGNKVLLYKPGILRKISKPQQGPYEVKCMYSNGTIHICKQLTQGVVSECIISDEYNRTMKTIVQIREVNALELRTPVDGQMFLHSRPT